ncbi:hypothetical protein VTN77DRAFT_5804 [Rasamsonia byssochlamydoides]|uniref:uncharacterized protein n=1 Tax=Rasamsonia byssochlamydoides TaxID=89139 RepID=UPI003743A8CD
MAGTAAAVYSADALTSSTNNAWDFAVPVGSEFNDGTSSKRASNDSTSAYPKSSSHRHRTPNGMPRSRTSSQSGSRRDSSAGREIGPPTAADRKGDGPGKFYSSTDPEVDDDNWIHRDKLARIESEELQQAAMRIQRQVRAGSKSSSLRGRSYDTHSLNGTVVTSPSTEYTEPWPSLQRQQLDSPIPLEDLEQEAPSEAERMNWDLRRPEEIAAESQDDSASAKLYKNTGLKKSSSRIPVLTTSPHPISPDQVEPSPFPVGNSTPPMTSSRPGSRAGPQSQSQSQAQASPAKKTPAKGTPSSTGRKSSAPSGNRKTSATQKQRAASGSNAKDRPGTRAGETRPTTAVNRPEGDPPWLATMYKPDPRLPPEQQMLPTHAKRLQQELWEKEGKTPSVYDREFAPLAVRPDDEPPRVNPEPAKAEPESQAEEAQAEEAEATSAEPPADSSSWPLKSPKSPEPSNRPGTSGTNYSTMPKVQTTPPVGLPVPQKAQPPPAAVPEPEKEEKGCGCCIVM